MRVHTTIHPRRDGTVRTQAPDALVIFASNAHGVLEAEVTPETGAWLLRLPGMFVGETNEGTTSLVPHSYPKDDSASSDGATPLAPQAVPTPAPKPKSVRKSRAKKAA